MQTPTEIIMAEVKLLKAKEKKIKRVLDSYDRLTEYEEWQLKSIRSQKRILLKVARKINKK